MGFSSKAKADVIWVYAKQQAVHSLGNKNPKPWCWGIYVDGISAVGTKEHFRPLQVRARAAGSDRPRVLGFRSQDVHAVKTFSVKAILLSRGTNCSLGDKKVFKPLKK